MSLHLKMNEFLIVIEAMCMFEYYISVHFMFIVWQ